MDRLGSGVYRHVPHHRVPGREEERGLAVDGALTHYGDYAIPDGTGRGVALAAQVEGNIALMRAENHNGGFGSDPVAGSRPDERGRGNGIADHLRYLGPARP